jgi:hypothetical protein
MTGQRVLVTHGYGPSKASLVLSPPLLLFPLSAAQSLPYSSCLSPPWAHHGRMFYCKKGKTPSIRASKTSMASPPSPCKLTLSLRDIRAAN